MAYWCPYACSCLFALPVQICSILALPDTLISFVFSWVWAQDNLLYANCPVGEPIPSLIQESTKSHPSSNPLNILNKKLWRKGENLSI